MRMVRMRPSFAFTSVLSLLLLNVHFNGAFADPLSFECPTPGVTRFLEGGLLSNPSPVKGTTAKIALSSTSSTGDVCILYLAAIQGDQPVARSYDGRDWEVSAGTFAGTVSEPSCDSSRQCTFDVLADVETLGDEGFTLYALRSFKRSTSRRAEIARFLEQSTFGTTRAAIDALDATNDGTGAPDFGSWIEYQVNPSTENGAGMSAHREFFRRHTNPRWEYPYAGGTIGLKSACEVSSRWRKFTFTERDGLVDFKSKISKYLQIKKINGRFVYFVEGMARTSTRSIGKIRDVDGKYMRDLQTAPVSYRLDDGRYLNDNHKYSCINCPVRICGTFGCGYIENPKVDLTGIKGTNLQLYDIVNLPDIMKNDGKMVSIDDGPYLKNHVGWQKPDDEFYLNVEIDKRQCSRHPTTSVPIPTMFNGVDKAQHVTRATPPIFGRTFNAETNSEEMMLFDPVFSFLDNTPENPLLDGGGALYIETDGEVHCANAPRTFLNEDHCKLSFDRHACTKDDYGRTRLGNGQGVVVCGSPGEVSSDFSNGVMNSYDIITRRVHASEVHDIYKDGSYTEQKYQLWYRLALTAEDQLRQRMAWVLYQIIPVGLPGGFVPKTELFLIYYDIYVRHAFGIYRNILREVSYNFEMGTWLSHYENRSLQNSIDTGGGIVYPDENFAREIMQLFSIGIKQLNMDGTDKLDDDGNTIPTYTSDDIMSYARAWTGFTKQVSARGNVENDSKLVNRIDPLRINRLKRDLFPKSDLQGGFIGDGYPLCVDLPERHFLRKGAVYRVLGSRSSPELQEDEEDWEENGLRLALDESSPLYYQLCAPDENDQCTFPGKIVLESNINYGTDEEKSLAEYNVDTIRTVRVQSGSTPVYYEYVRTPCVHQNFFNNGRKIIAGGIGRDLIVKHSLCADPRTYLAAEACCPQGWEENGESGIRFCAYNGERMRFSSAVQRCKNNGREQCNPKNWATNPCMDESTHSWTTAGCAVKAKVPFGIGENYVVARVDYPDPDWAGKRNVPSIVRDDTLNFFQVQWSDRNMIPADVTSCDAISSCYSVVDGCICDTNVVETPAFTSANEINSKDEIEKNLHIGAFSPEMFDVQEFKSLGDCGVEELQVFSKDGNCDSLNTSTIFMITDQNGLVKYIKNMISNVEIEGISGLNFRNPVHFIDFADQNLRDMQYETEAVIDSFFYYPSHPPFLARRIIQRFGISNPSPQYIERVSIAYKNGSYMEGRFGSGKYGDLEAMIAAVLLDPEARSVSLDADPGHGHVREPLIKMTSFLRSMDLAIYAPLKVPMIYAIDQVHRYGQGPYRSLSVFSFFKPEHAPSGVVTDAGLVSPESNMLDGKVLALLNGFFSTVKFGLAACAWGFGKDNWGSVCPKQEGVVTADAFGELTYSVGPRDSVDDVLDDLSLLLTSSRLGESNRGIIKANMESAFRKDRAKGVRIAQQLMAITPEFHTTNLSEKDGNPRLVAKYTADPSGSYKAVIFFHLDGGADTFNVLVPRRNCRGGKDMYNEYRRARSGVGLSEKYLLDIDARGSDQICDTFGVNNNFPLLQKLYSDNEAIFFANTGILSKPLTKFDSWSREAKIPLFAHNHMVAALQRVDPHRKRPGTGIGGRMLDILRRHGFHTSSNSVKGRRQFSKGSSLDNNPVWNVATTPAMDLDMYSTVGPDMFDIMKQLNGEGGISNSIYGDTWSERLSQTIFEYEEELELQKLLDSGEIDMDQYPRGGTLNQKFRSMATFMKMRDYRKVDRDVFFIDELGFDSHSETLKQVNKKFETANDALHFFMDEMKRQGIWNDVVIVMGSDFGRTISVNSNGGTDHAWGGNYFMIGGGVNGGKILGKYPEHLTSESTQWITGGRFIPTTPWDSVWTGIANWMGVRGDKDLEYMLPNRVNFDKCSMFTDEDLFVDSNVPRSSCTFADGDGDGVPDDIDECPDTEYWKDQSVNEVGCVGPPAPQTSAPVGPPTITNSPTSSPVDPPTITNSPTQPLPTKSPTMIPTRDVSDFQPVYSVIDPESIITSLGRRGEGGEFYATDRTTYKISVKKNGNGPPGFEITPTWPWSIVKGIRVYTANDGPSRDPVNYVLEGRLNESDSWSLISKGDLALPVDRNPPGLDISSTPGSPDMTLNHDDISIPNSLIFSYYRVTFPGTRKTSSDIMQIAEIELPGVLAPNGGGASPTASPTASPVAETSSPTKSPIKTPTGSPVAETSSPTTKSPTNQTPSPSKPSDFQPVYSVLDPESIITSVGGDGKGSEPNAIDRTTNKFAVRKDGNGPPGFEITPTWPWSIVKGIRVYTAGDRPTRDPTKYILEGRLNESDSWSLISKGKLALPVDRNPPGLDISSTPGSPDMDLHHDDISIPNSLIFSYYRVTFPGTKKSSSDIMQIAEIELPGVLAPNGGGASPTASPVAETSSPTDSPVRAPTGSPVAETSSPTTKSPTSYPTPSPSARPSTSPSTSIAPSPGVSGAVRVNTVLDPDSIVSYVGSTNTDLAISNAIDGTTNIVTIHQDLNMADDPGFIAAPSWPSSIVKGIRIYASNGHQSRDPSMYTVEGRANEFDTWHLISKGNIELTSNRNPLGREINSTSFLADTKYWHYETYFTNNEVYAQYKVTFADTAGNEDAVSFAEVELPGMTVPIGSESPTTSPAPTNKPSLAPVPEPTQSPTTTTQPSSRPSMSPITVPVNKTPVSSILDPHSSIILVGATSTAGGERFVDATTNKASITKDKDATIDPGFVAIPSWRLSVVKGIRVYSNDRFKWRDPTSYKLEGRESEGDAWVLISEGSVVLSKYRNAQGIEIKSSFEQGDTSLRHEEVFFSNDVAFSQYRVTFPTTRDGDIYLAMAEIELPGILLPMEGTPSPTNPPVDNLAPSVTPTLAPSRPPVDDRPVSSVLDPDSSATSVGTKKSSNLSGMFDGTTTKATLVKDKDATIDPGFVVVPSWNLSIVKGIRVYTADNFKFRDPKSYKLEGRENDSDAWVLISEGLVKLGKNRNKAGKEIESSFEQGDTSLKRFETTFTNDAAFSQYRVTFPTIKGSPYDKVQVGEVELPGILVSDNAPPTSPPVNNLVPSVTPTLAPSGPPVDARPVSSVLDPDSSATSVGTEKASNLSGMFDGTTTKASLTKDNDATIDPGFVVVPSWNLSIVKGIRVYNANNFKFLDPASYKLEGRESDSDAWVLISEGLVKLSRNRNAGGIVIESSFEQGDTSLKRFETSFANDAAFSQYRVTFPTIKGSPYEKVQIGEVELPGILI